VRRDEAGARSEVEVIHAEGLATHRGPESWADDRKVTEKGDGGQLSPGSISPVEGTARVPVRVCGISS